MNAEYFIFLFLYFIRGVIRRTPGDILVALSRELKDRVNIAVELL